MLGRNLRDAATGYWLCCLFAALLLAAGPLARGAVSADAEGPGAIRVGLARACITPQEPLWLHGYASPPRFRPSVGKLNDLYAKAMAIEDARGERAVLITVDVCVLRPAEAKALFDLLCKNTGLERRQILVNLSHTHSGPIIGGSDLDRYPMTDADRQATLAYTERLFDQLSEIAVAALADLKPATLTWGTGKCDFVRNRRLYHPDGRYRGMGPNPAGHVDDRVPVLCVNSPEGKLRGVVFGLACHPVTLHQDSLKISGDYAGFAQEAIEARHPGVQAMFVQGCGADANSEPRCGPEQEKNVRLQGESLAAEVCRVAAKPLEPIRGPLDVRFREADLPLKPAPSREELAKMTGAMAHNGSRMLAALERGEPLPTHHRHPLALWRFGKDLTLVALSGEVVSGYVPLLNEALRENRLWIAGYSNEVDGYLPDARIIAEGGYEARGLVADVGFYSADAEAVLVKAVVDLAGEPAARWTAEKANAWYDSQPWPVGCNYVPSTAINQIETWQAESFDPETIDRELGWAESLGFNTVRVFSHDLVWEADPQGFKDRVRKLLDLCEKHHIRVIFTFFTNGCYGFEGEARLGKQPDPVPGVHNSGWVQSPGAAKVNDPAEWGRLERYVKDVLTTFATDDRILVWDLYNEPENRKKGAESLPLLREEFAWARSVNPSQPLTACIDKLETSPLNSFLAENCDVITFHTYGGPKSATSFIAALRKHGRPLLCTEYMGRPSSTFQEILPIFQRERVGAISWGLVAGKMNTIFPWGSKPGTPEPDVWFHDIFRGDGTPYDPEEIALIRRLTGRDR